MSACDCAGGRRRDPRVTGRFGVYLSGPMADCDEAEAGAWRREATALLSDKMFVYDPHARDAARGRPFVAGDVPEDKEAIDVSDVVLVNAWKPSTGTAMEVLYAWERKKVVVTIVREGLHVHPWIAHHSMYLVPSLAHAVKIIRQLA